METINFAILTTMLLPTQLPQEASDRDEILGQDLAISTILSGHRFLHPERVKDSKFFISDMNLNATLLIWKHPLRLRDLNVFEHGDLPND